MSLKKLKLGLTNSDIEDKQSLELEVLNCLSKQAGLVPVPVILSGVLYSYFAYTKMPVYAWGSWLGALLLIVLIRFMILTKLPIMEHVSLARRMRWAITLSLINGFIHGASAIFFIYFSFAERSILTLVQLGLTAGSVATTAGYRPLFLSFNIPMLAPLVVMWGITPLDSNSVVVQISIVLLICMYFSIQNFAAANYFNLFQESIKIRNERKELNEQLNGALDQVTSISESKTRFLAAASHDLRQPIHTLQLFGTALSMRSLDQESSQIATYMETAIDNLASQMDNLLDISKLDAGLIRKNLKVVNLVEYFNIIKYESEPIAIKKNLTFAFISELNTASTLTDYEQFDRIIRNLISNAIKYTPSGAVVVMLSDRDSYWEISIEDTGVGISDEEQTRIFEEFYQVGNQARNPAKGLGLGLSIVKRLCDFLEISLVLKSEEGLGTMVTLELSKASPSRFSELKVADDSQSLAGLNVLCLDDERSIRQALKALLGEFGCDVVTCATIDDALLHAKKRRPDIMLVDFRLSGQQTGIDAIKQVRAIYSDLPSLLVSGDTSPKRLNEAEDAGIDILYKPVKAEVLKRAIIQRV